MLRLDEREAKEYEAFTLNDSEDKKADQRR